ncbi:MAG TPA: hypothetical protein VK826_09405, partial [Bacteroidia bacterium]|nr:hypothetical protein [Bacteroidia bacterium]
MPKVPRTVLKEYFQTGDKPSAAQFGIFIDSTVNFVDDRDFIGLREYNPAADYLPGDTAVFNDQVVRCLNATTGPYDPADWTVLAAFGSVTYMGSWDTQANVPFLQSGVGTQGFYYVVTNASIDPGDNTDLDGTSDWITGDWAIFNGAIWERVDYSQAPYAAQNVSFVPTVNITSTNAQDAIEEVYSDLDTNKADKIVPAVTGNFAGLAADGNLIDSTVSATDFLSSTTEAINIPFTPTVDITAVNVQDAIEEVYSDLETNKADKIIPAATGNFAGLAADGNLIDSTKSATDFLPSTTEAIDIPFTPSGNIGAGDVQSAIEELDAEKQGVISLTPNFYPYADTSTSLADGVISNESNGVALTVGKVLRSAATNEGQISFGAAGDEVRLTTDGSFENESKLLMTPTDLSMHGPEVTVGITFGGPNLHLESGGIVSLSNGFDTELLLSGDHAWLKYGTLGGIRTFPGPDSSGVTFITAGSAYL